MRKHEEALQRLHEERQSILRQEELEADMVRRGIAGKGELERERIRKQQTKLAKAQATRVGLSMDQQVNLLKDVHGVRRELQQAEVSTPSHIIYIRTCICAYVRAYIHSYVRMYC